jgi:hypothetical protein
MAPNTNFPVLRKMSDGLFVIDTAGQCDMWTLRKLRKPSKCVATGRQLVKGERHYGPVTNGDHRGWRLHREYVENALPNNQESVR